MTIPDGKVEISLEDWTKLNDRIVDLERQKESLSKRLDYLTDMFCKLGIPECVVNRLGKDVELTSQYTDTAGGVTRSYRIDFTVSREVLANE